MSKRNAEGKRAALSSLKVGDRARVIEIGGADAVRHRLGALGFVPGALVSVVQTSFGNMILGIHDSRIAVNEDLARRISVVAA